MKLISLTKGFVTMVDDEDFNCLSQRTWHVSSVKSSPLQYAITNNGKIAGKHSLIRMHRLIMGAVPGQQVDHIDGNSLNNQRANLRFVTNAQNGRAKCAKRRNGGCSSRFRGVSWHPQSGKWRARVFFNYRQYCAGCHSTEEEAALAYNRKATQLGFLPEALNILEAA